jgi:hypothetical protein
VPIDLHVNDPAQVASVQRIDATIDAGREMIILSGIARPERQCTDDAHSYPDEVIVHLGVQAPHVQQATATVGLASIHADDTNFVLATDSATVDPDPQTGELRLHIDTNIMGDPARLNRIGYQVIAIVPTADSWVRGVVRWHSQDTGVPLPAADPETLRALLHVTLARVENVSDGEFWKTIYIPVLDAHYGSPGMDGNWVVVPFDFANPPMGDPLTVRVTPSLAFSSGLYVNQVAGPVNFTLDPANATLDGIVIQIAPTPRLY